jgi:DNA polymerase I-like protein with 3'-5' exonuclease and polymerase domains
MIPSSIEAFSSVVVLDAEYVADAGQPYDPVALGVCIYDGTDRVQVYDRTVLLQWRELPFPVDAETLVVCYNAGAEAGFLHALGLGIPVCWLDLMAESRVMRNVCLRKGLVPAFEKRHPEILAPNRDISLLRTAALFGVDGGNPDAKEDARDVILSRKWEGGDQVVWQQIREYCASDVQLTARLFAKMEPHLDLQAALIRGRYAVEHGRMEQRGIPVDVETFTRLQREHGRILQRYRVDVDSSGDRLTVKGRVRQTWLANKIRELGAEQFHQQTPKGQWSTRAVHLEETAVRFEDAELLRVAQWVDLLWLFPEGKDGALRISPLGDDGRIRYHQFAFATHTGRSLGLGREALMQLSAWMRGLIQPQPGEVLLSADYSAQEIAVAAGLSGDPQLREAYLSGDPYVAVGEMAGLIRPGMSEGEIRQLRKLCKALTLGRLYGMGLSTFRRRSGVSYGQAARVWQFFDRTFTKFNDWQARVVAQARRRGWITTKFGWKAQVVTTTSTTTLYNWAVQAGAGDVLKLAVIRVAQAGFDILTTCHDSLLVSIPDDRVEERCTALTQLMAEAGEIAVGIPIRVDVQVVRPGERLLTSDTGPMWSKIMGLLGGT